MERTTNARDAVQLMGDLAVAHGFHGQSGALEGGGESLMVADPDEGFVFHVLADKTGTSAIWVAQRVPDDSMAVVANMYTVREVDLDDTFNFLGRQDVWELAADDGLWMTRNPRTSRRRSPTGNTATSTTRRRMWGAWRLVAPAFVEENVPAEYGNLRYDAPYPVAVPVEKKLTPQDVMAVHREWYSGTQFDLGAGLQGGFAGSPDRYNGCSDGDAASNAAGVNCTSVSGNWERAIGLYRTSDTVVLQARGWLPDAVGGRSVRPGRRARDALRAHRLRHDRARILEYLHGWQGDDLPGQRAKNGGFWASRVAQNVLQLLRRHAARRSSGRPRGRARGRRCRTPSPRKWCARRAPSRRRERTSATRRRWTWRSWTAAHLSFATQAVGRGGASRTSCSSRSTTATATSGSRPRTAPRPPSTRRRRLRRRRRGPWPPRWHPGGKLRRRRRRKRKRKRKRKRRRLAGDEPAVFTSSALGYPAWWLAEVGYEDGPPPPDADAAAAPKTPIRIQRRRRNERERREERKEEAERDSSSREGGRVVSKLRVGAKSGGGGGAPAAAATEARRLSGFRSFVLSRVGVRGGFFFRSFFILSFFLFFFLLAFFSLNLSQFRRAWLRQSGHETPAEWRVCLIPGRSSAPASRCSTTSCMHCAWNRCAHGRVTSNEDSTPLGRRRCVCAATTLPLPLVLPGKGSIICPKQIECVCRTREEHLPNALRRPRPRLGLRRLLSSVHKALLEEGDGSLQVLVRRPRSAAHGGVRSRVLRREKRGRRERRRKEEDDDDEDKELRASADTSR